MTGLLELIGTIRICVTDPKKSYIVGASDAANKEFQDSFPEDFGPMPKELLAGGMELTEDMYERAGITKFTCENYNDILKVTGMPGCIFTDENGREVRNQVSALMHDYHTGKISKDEVMGKVRDICLDMRVYQSQCRHTTGYDKKDNLQILGQLYELFQKKNVNNAVAACYEKGDSLDVQNGGSGKNCIYYDADYYYASVEMREMLQEAIASVAEEWGADAPDFESLEKNTKYTLDGKMDFNSVWNWHAWNRSGGRMTDFDDTPHEGFTFFYQEKKYDAEEGLSPLERQKGIIRIAFHGMEWEMDVPFNNSLLFGEVKNIFNAGTLFQDYLGEGKGDAKLISFLKKFDVFTSAYGHNI